VSADAIAFVYAGDIWLVPKNGGEARRLSSPAGEESFPRFSPDGRRIAFSANYDGNVDVYVVPAEGGVPHRVTYHPDADRLLDWTPDGKELLFASTRNDPRQGRTRQIYRVAAEGGLPRQLPMPYGEFAALAGDGHRLAYTPKSRDFRNWKRYRGGMAPDIWLFDLETNAARNLTASDANEAQPMWHGDTLYFLSDRDAYQRSNLWAMNVDSGTLRQLTTFTDVDVAFSAIGPSDIVFQAGSRLYRFELATEKIVEVPVEVVTDLSTVLPHLEKVGDLIASAGISPSGKRAVFEARGELFTVPEEHGPVLQLTHSSGSAERYPAWSPDGSMIAYWTDRTGEYQLAVQPADGGEEKLLTDLGPGFRYHLYWSPDSTKLAFVDNTGTIQLFERAGRKLTAIDQDRLLLHPGLDGFEVSWSADSRWLAYSKALETQNSAVFLYDTDSGEGHQVTSGYYSDTSPVFDPAGDYLYYLSNRDLAPIYSDLDATWIYPNTTRIVAAPLRPAVASPLAPRNDVEAADDKGEKAKDDEKTEKDDDKAVEIALDGLEARGVVLPMPAGNYRTLRAVKGKVLVQRMPRTGSADEDRPIVYWDLEEREESTVLGNAGGYEVSADGKKLLVANRGAYSIVKVAPKQKPEGRLATDELAMTVDPRAEWRQMFNDIWRTYRDYFYDPEIHGLDWNALREQYGAMLEDAVTRWDANFVYGQLIAEVSSSHTYVGGGQTERARRERVGLLGVDWELENGAYRIAHIVRGAPWDVESRSPLTEPGVDVAEGDYVLAVNGISVDPEREPYAAFQGLAGEEVMLSVNSEPTLDGARQVLVRTIDDETELRHREWVEANRLKVLAASGGRIGYVYVPNTALSGQTELVRQFASQVRVEGLIIDERFNAGGQLPDRFIEQMNRRLVTRIAFRNGGVATVPGVTHYGPKAMLINGWAGSGGDAFPFFFQELGVGPLIGERTWGGLIGPAIGHRTIDGGYYTAPPGRLYGVDGEWFAEGIGVAPDIPVVDDPAAMAAGGDPQLEAAVVEVLRLLAENPPKLPEPPPFELRTAPASR